jgi:hypothetical protein
VPDLLKAIDRRRLQLFISALVVGERVQIVEGDPADLGTGRIGRAQRDPERVQGKVLSAFQTAGLDGVFERGIVLGVLGFLFWRSLLDPAHTRRDQHESRDAIRMCERGVEGDSSAHRALDERSLTDARRVHHWHEVLDVRV